MRQEEVDEKWAHLFGLRLSTHAATSSEVAASFVSFDRSTREWATKYDESIIATFSKH